MFYRHLLVRFAFLAAGCCVYSTILGQAAKRSLSIQSLPEIDQRELHRALDAYDVGDTQTAEPLLRDLNKRYPSSYEAAEALGSLYVETDDLTHAVPLLEHAAVLSPHQSIASANLGAAYLKVGRLPDAVRELKRAAALEPLNSATMNSLGQAWMLQRQPAAAAKAFAAAAAAAPDDAQIRYNWALALYETGSVTQAAELLESTPADAMTDQIHALAGDANEKAGRFAQALTHFEAAAHTNPSESNLYALTVELMRHWNWSEAIKVSEFGAQQHPQSAARFRLASGISYYGKGEYKESVGVLSALLRQDPDNSSIADLLGHSCGALADGQNKDCTAVYDFAQRHPGNAVMSTYAAIALLHATGDEANLSRAETLLRTAIARDPNYSEAWLRLGVLQQVRLEWAESAKSLERAATLNRESPEAHYRLSRAYAHMGRHEDAQIQTALYQSCSEKAKASLNTRMQEVMQFVLTPG